MELSAELVEFVRREQAERAIFDVFIRFAHALDDQVEDDWVDCFTEGASFSITLAGAEDPVIAVRGHDELRRWFAERTRSVPDTANHVVLNPLFTWLADDRAAVVSYFVGVTSPAGEIITQAGRYHDIVVRGADGAWRLAERRGLRRVGNPPIVESPG